MPGTNLTREEARDRAETLSVTSYTVDLDLTRSIEPGKAETQFASTTVIRFSGSQPGASTFADLVGATIHELTLNGRSLDPAVAYKNSRILLEDLAEVNELRVVADCTYSRTGEGLHRFVDPADDRVYTYTQFEVPDARRVYTTFEQPDLKASFTFNVTAPTGWKVVSNAPTPEPVDAGEGTSIWHFPATERISTYITAVVAGEYHEHLDSYQGKHGEIPLGHYCRQSMVDFLHAEDLLEITKQGFAFFEEAFDFPYPFGKYDQLYVPEYNMGAMENAGCVTYRDDYLPRSRETHSFYEQRANTILHEMAHMWFGDLVTMRWWDDLWLNESFAEWASTHASVQATQYVEAWTGFTNSRKNWAYRQDQLPSTHPIAADNHDLEAVEVNFDGITYAKGASALRQLVAWVGEDDFLKGLRAYFKKHAFANSELKDLLGALEEASGRDLHAWSEEWLQTSGVNTLRPEFTVDADGMFASFAVKQTAHPDFATLRRHRIGIGLYDAVLDSEGNNHLVRRTFVETDITGEHSDIVELVGQKPAHLVLVNDGDLTYAKVRLDERSLATVVSSIDTLEDSLARALCWGATWDMTRDGEMSTTDFVKLVLQGVGSESDLTAVGALLGYAQLAVDTFSNPATRDSLKSAWEEGLRKLLENAGPGSDHQLALTRAYGSAALSDAGLTFVQGLYDGSIQLDGLAIDTDLRWTLLKSLAHAGRADRDAVLAERERDRTISGQEHAAGAMTVIPTAEAKQEAWNDAVIRDDVPNETQRNIAFSFQVPGQEELLEPYVAKYLEVASTIWEDKGVQRATTALKLLFPRALATRKTLDAVDAWLESSDANPAAKRYVREGRSGIERALAAQAKDAG